MNGEVTKCEHREYGYAEIEFSGHAHPSAISQLFAGISNDMSVCALSPLQITSSHVDQVWMSHGDQLSKLPDDFVVIGKTKTAPYACIAHVDKPIYGIQFHPEVTHSPRGKEIIKNFVVNICQCRTNWTMVCAHTRR
jgi:GMP synthase (glutamine-hydrolysing)